MLATAAFILTRPSPDHEADLTVWTFSNTHHDSFRQTIPAYQRKHEGLDIDLQLVHYRVLDRRLRAAMWAGLDVPDLVEVNFNRAGSFFRGPADATGFVDLTPWLNEAGASGVRTIDRVLPARLAAYTNRGRVFGLPHDVHPHVIAYRKDIFEAAGIDASQLETWDEFIEAGRRLTVPGERYMMLLDDTGVMSFEAVLLQRGGGFFDADGQLAIDDEVTVQTMLWFVPLVAGPERIADNPAAQGQAFYKAVGDGYVLSFICPDWMTSKIEMNLPQLSGRLALMPMPAVEPGGRRTTVRSGTMLAITEQTGDARRAWDLAKHLYFDRELIAERFRATNTIPPNRDAWDHPVFQEPRPFWSGQRIGTLFIKLSDEVPTQYSSPYQETAAAKVGEALAGACVYYRRHGDDGFEPYVRQRLLSAAEAVRVQMRRNPF